MKNHLRILLLLVTTLLFPEAPRLVLLWGVLFSVYGKTDTAVHYCLVCPVLIFSP